MRYILKCLFFFSLCPDIYVVSERVALLTHIIWCSAPVDCAVFYFSFSRSAVLNRYLEKLFYLAIFFFIFDECGFTMKDFDRGLFFPSAWWFCARLYEMLMCFSVQWKHWMMVLTFKGKMTDHRGFALVAVGRALFISNTSGFCIKLKQIYHRLVAVTCKPAGVMFLLILHPRSPQKTVAITCQMVLITGPLMCATLG